jgi:hypothetical protein
MPDSAVLTSQSRVLLGINGTETRVKAMRFCRVAAVFQIG